MRMGLINLAPPPVGNIKCSLPEAHEVLAKCVVCEYLSRQIF